MDTRHKSWGALKARVEQVTDLLRLQRELQDMQHLLATAIPNSVEYTHYKTCIAHMTRDISQIEEHLGDSHGT